MKIIFIQTGGTIDKDYPKTRNGWAFEIGEPAVDRILQLVHPSFDFEILTAFKKDSLQITLSDRKVLLSIIQNHQEHIFIVTHGTDTFIETARFLDGKIPEKLIILTGAMRPERFTNSDASFNLGAAIGASNLLQKGVYVAMNGLVKPVIDSRREEHSDQFI